MKTGFKKTMAILLVLVMLFVLGACGGKDSPSNVSNVQNENNASNDTNDTNSEDAASDETDSEEIYNVVLEWISTGSIPSEENMQKIEAAINEITEPAIGVTVTLYPVAISNLESENTLAISTGEKIDLICSVGTGVGNLVNSGLLIEMDELFEKYGADMKSTLGDAIKGGYYDGKLYGVPNAYIQGESYGFNARTDLLEKYNIEIDPNKYYTMEELGEIFETVKAGERDGFYCIAGIQSTSDIFTDYLGTIDTLGATTASGALLLKDNWDNTTIENVYASDQFAEYAKTMYEWAQKGYIQADAASNTETAIVQIKAGNYLGRIYYIDGSAPTDFERQTGYECTLIRMVEPYKETSRFQNILWSIPITSENPEKAFQFLNMLYADNDIDTILQFGLEGETWQVIEEDDKGNRVIDFVDGIADASEAPYYCYAGVYGDRLSWPIWTPDGLDFNDKLRQLNDSIDKVSPALGYCFVITDETSAKYSAVSSVISEYVGVISAGAVNPDELLPKFIEELEVAGINDVIAENQRQLDYWLAQQ